MIKGARVLLYFILTAGVCHTDDMNLVVENPDMDPTKTKQEWDMSNFLMDMWVSVAYNGGSVSLQLARKMKKESLIELN